jgi:hypothetical protein
MGCGCKGNQEPAPQTQAPQTQQVQPGVQTAPTQNSVQESIKKTIEKYYTKKG